ALQEHLSYGIILYLKLCLRNYQLFDHHILPHKRANVQNENPLYFSQNYCTKPLRGSFLKPVEPVCCIMLLEI
ncbi:MAG: hypothetical protein FWB92_10415, partial [Oscillospiraceae bacterium]|nr:hypothetical protein [Oscillospiraceae bacterium]